MKNTTTFWRRHSRLLLLLLPALWAGGLTMHAASVATDKSDYQPGDRVTITGEGWKPGESVSITITEINPPTPQTPTTWIVTADGKGSISDKSYPILQRHLGVSFTLEAAGHSSGLQAQTDFTDGPTGTPPPAGVAPIHPPAGGFGIDGDLMANTPSLDVGDWLPGAGGTGGSVLDASGAPLNPITTMHMVDPYNDSSGDRIFGGGEKWFDDPNLWNWSSGKPSSKTDINNVLFHIGADADGHIWGTIAADRYSTSGDSYIDFEFLQNTMVRNDDGTFTSEGLQGGRTVNDLLISLAFTGGGKVADFFIWSWQPDGKGGYAYVDMTDSIPAGRVFAALNEATIDAPYGAFGGTTYGRYAFAEGTVDLTTLLSIFDPCMSLVVQTIMVKTKASQSSNASIEDMIDPIQVRLTIGPSAEAGADQVACDAGESNRFDLSGQASQGLFPVASTEWSVLEGDATIDDPSALNTFVDVLSGSALLRLTVIQQNGCVSTDEVLLTVTPLPTCDIAGPTMDLCPDSLAEFSAPEGMDSYAWSISGNGEIMGANDGRTVMVRTGADCALPFTLSLDVIKDNCLSSCTTEVMVSDTAAPLLSLPSDVTVECDASTAPDATGMASATDTCDDNPMIRFSDEMVPGECADSSTIHRTWTATDACGNTSSGVQRISVVDTTPPSITCPADLTVECDASTAPDATGVATALDACDAAPAITFNDEVIPGDNAQEMTIRRTWTAADACGNTASCVQTIRIVDTTPPVITCPPEATVECDSSSAPSATGSASATDNCDPAPVITHQDEVVPGASDQEMVIRRTWTATDASGNAASCEQVIHVVDTTAPQLTVPASATLECDGDHSPDAAGMASATDNCDAAPRITWADTVEPGDCAGTKVITRTWTATDASGNATQADQTIQVVDTTPPLITCPADVTIECDQPNDPSATGMATATDHCDPSPVVTHSDEILPGDCPSERVIVRTWTATDCRGNSASCQQRITIQDTTAPWIEVPAGLTLECPADTSPSATGRATGGDNCGEVTIRHEDDVQVLCGASRVITRTWTARDECGNATSGVQVIRVEDNTPPVLSCVVATTYSQGGYGGGGTPAEILMANYFTAFPNGATVGIYDPSNGAEPPNGLHWEATAEGLAQLRLFINQGGGTSRALDGDFLNPGDEKKLGELAAQVLTLTLNMRFNELGIIGIGPNNFADLVYTREGDSLSGLTVREILEVANRALAGYELPEGHSYLSLDEIADLLNHAFHAGNHSEWAQAYLEVPVVIVQCSSEVPAADPSRLQAHDACDGKVTLIHEGDSIIDQSCPGRYTILRQWTAMDECGNTASCSQTIVVDDTTAPTMSGESERMVSTDSSWDFIEPVATDNCGGTVALAIVGTVTNVLADNALVATRTWEALDGCGNAATFTQTVTVGNVMAVQSTFDSSTDNWTLLSYTDTQDPTHMEANGASGGYVASQTDGSEALWFWTAPSQFLGDRTDYYGGVLTFSLMLSAEVGSPLPPAVVLVSGNLTLVCTLEEVAGTSWTTYTVQLVDSHEWINAATGEAASQEEMLRVLSELEHLLIQVDLGDASVSAGLDDVAMVPAANLDVLTWALQVEPAGVGVVRLIWPAVDEGYQVEESDNLITPNWRVLDVTPEEVSGYFRFEYQPESSPKFFRLYKPAP